MAADVSRVLAACQVLRASLSVLRPASYVHLPGLPPWGRARGGKEAPSAEGALEWRREQAGQVEDRNHERQRVEEA